MPMTPQGTPKGPRDARMSHATPPYDEQTRTPRPAPTDRTIPHADRPATHGGRTRTTRGNPQQPSPNPDRTARAPAPVARRRHQGPSPGPTPAAAARLIW
jgi:hypothetical protein